MPAPTLAPAAARRCGHAVLAALALSAADPAAAQAPAPATSATGRVTAADTGVPLRRARIEVSSDRTRNPLFTDDDGRFVIRRADRERFTITASKAGYAFTSVSGIAAASTPLRVMMLRAAVISGRILDEYGAPQVAAPVLVTRLDAGAGSGGTRTVFTAVTDDRGEYRVGGLPPGRYSVGAQWGAAPIPGLRPAEIQGTLTIASAIAQAEAVATSVSLAPPPRPVAHATDAIAVRSGDDVRGVDVRLPPLMTARRTRMAMGRSGSPRGAADLPERLCPGNAVVRGRVLTTDGTLLAGAAVRVSGRPIYIPDERTDGAGEYVVDCLPPGEYTVEIARSAYMLPDGSASSREKVTVRDDQAVARAPDVVFQRAGSMTGTIVDEHGEPIEGATVRALQVRHVSGRTRAVPAAIGRRTDDRGQFRIFGLAPGEYLLLASVGASLHAEAPRITGYAPLYYPGTTRMDTAAQVRVDPGADVSGLDIVYRPSPAVPIRGTAINAAGAPARGTVLLSLSGRAAQIAVEPIAAPIGSEGAFTIPDIPPGEYVVHAVISPGPGTAAEFGSEYVAVTDQAPAPVLIRTSTGGTLEGRITFEDGDPDRSRRAPFALMTYPVDDDRAPFPGQGSGVVWQSDGTFYAVGLYGPRRIALISAPPGGYLKSVTIAGTDVTDTGFHLPGATAVAGAEIVLSTRGASLSGRVVDGRGRPAAASVVVIPADRNLWRPYSRHLKLAAAGENGSVEVDGLPPGEYWIAAVERLETGGAGDEWQDPRLLETLVSGAERVTLGEGERHALEAPLRRLVR